MRLSKNCLFLVLAVWACTTCSSRDQSSQTGENKTINNRTLEYTTPVTILNADKTKKIAHIEAALADTPEKRNMGLMDVQNLPADKGMLFIFDKEEPRSFWMANTPLSLDIIFVARDSSIVRIHHSTTPYAETNYKSENPAQYVVEVNGGFCINNDVVEGGYIRF